MTTPPTPDQPDDTPTAEQPSVHQPQPEQAPPQSAPGQPYQHQPLPPIAGPYQAQPSYPYPFAPRVREPWVNPAKRGVLVLVAVLLGLVLLGGGVAIGAAVSNGNDGHHAVYVRPLPNRGDQFGQGRGGPVVPRPRFTQPNATPSAPSTPSPTPSSSHS